MGTRGQSARRAWSRKSAARRVGEVAAIAGAVALVGGLAFAAAGQSPASTPNAGTVPSQAFKQAERTYPPMMAVISDSYTGGSEMGGMGDKGWSNIVATSKGWRDCAYSLGGSGWTRGRDGLTFGARIDWAVSQKPQVIVFFNGINDIDGGADQIEAASATALADAKAKAGDTPIVVIGPVLARDIQLRLASKMRDDVKAAADAAGVAFIDPIEEGWFAGDKRALIGSDNFHPTDEGHQYMAGLIEADLDRIGLGNLSAVPLDQGRACSVPPLPAIAPTTGP
jgi:lysophospholipase L1-like esterase